MSLNWDLTGVKSRRGTGRFFVKGAPDKKVVPANTPGAFEEVLAHTADGTPIPWGVTDALIWLTMGVGMGWNIKTDKEVREFAYRIAAYQRVHGPVSGMVPAKAKGVAS